MVINEESSAEELAPIAKAVNEKLKKKLKFLEKAEV